MKHLTTVVLTALLACIAMSCGKESIWDKYEEWRLENNAWYLEQKELKGPDGQLWYHELTPWWNPTSGVLAHYYNDTTLNRDNLSPLQSSTVSVQYRGTFYNDAAFDSSYTMVDSIMTTALDKVIVGWQVALYSMHIGDSVDVVIPYTQAYGISGNGGIPPYTALKFNIKLVGIPYYEQRPD